MAGARLATVHVDTGREVRSSARRLGKTGSSLLGRDGADAPDRMIWKPWAWPGNMPGISPNWCCSRPGIARAAGCDGVVCAGTEVKAVRAAFGPEFLVVCPGIRPAWAAVPGDHQQRVMTPYEAIKAGADYIVVGRPIRLAADPVAAADKVVAEIEQGMRERSRLP